MIRKTFAYVQSSEKKDEAYFSSSSDILPRKMLSRRAPMCDISQSSGRQEICDIYTMQVTILTRVGYIVFVFVLYFVVFVFVLYFVVFLFDLIRGNLLTDSEFAITM